MVPTNKRQRKFLQWFSETGLLWNEQYNSFHKTSNVKFFDDGAIRVMFDTIQGRQTLFFDDYHEGYVFVGIENYNIKKDLK